MTVLLLFMHNHSNFQTRQCKKYKVLEERIGSKGVLYALDHAFGIQ